MRVVRIVAAAAVMLLWAAAAGHAEKRVALVVGNDRYAHLPANEQLQKAANDARAVGGALKQIGFDVIAGENLGRSALVDKLDELVQRLTPGDTAFFFFSGHGVDLDGVNYILPADVPDIAPGQDTRLKGAALGEQYIISELTGRGVRVAIVVLDACRTNPFARSGARSVGGARGLAPPPQVQGVFSLYAASAGQAARDRLSDDDRNPNSVFSRVLVPALTKPGVDLTALAFDVREEVARIARLAGYEQRPAYYDETIGGRVYLVPAAAVPPAVTPPAVTPPPEVAPLRATADPSCGGPVTASFPSRCAAPLTAAQERGLRLGDSFRECEHCPEMATVPAGAFTMGSPEGEDGRQDDEGPRHVVTVRRFAAGRMHVTVDQFAAFVVETGYEASAKCWTSEGGRNRERSDRSWRNPGFEQEGSHPAVCLTWNDAKAYVDWLARKTGRPYRLLSEAEWEYAARSRMSPGAYPRFWFGNDERAMCRYGNGEDEKARDTPGIDTSHWPVAPCNDGYARTAPAGTYEPNAFGLYDMAGNALQWTADCWHHDYSGAPADGSAWTAGSCRAHVLRGSAWDDAPGFMRTAHRSVLGGAYNTVGMRVARTLGP